MFLCGFDSVNNLKILLCHSSYVIKDFVQNLASEIFDQTDIILHMMKTPLHIIFPISNSTKCNNSYEISMYIEDILSLPCKIGLFMIAKYTMQVKAIFNDFKRK